MPIPSVLPNEDENKFINRCIRQIVEEYGQFVANGICYNQYRKKEEMKKKEDLFVIQPRKTEGRGQYLSRCSNNSKMRRQFPNIKERSGFCLTSFNEYYKYWNKMDFSMVPEDSALGDCITKKKAQGLDYKEAYARCASKVVAPNVDIVLAEDNLLIEPVEFNEIDIFGYNTKYFYICPGAVSTFQHLIKMNPDEETARMIRNAAVIADNVFEIEAKVLQDETATIEQLERATLLVDDFYDLMDVIDDELDMIHDVSYMEGHLEKISSYIGRQEFIEPNPCWEGYEAIGLKDDGTPNCVPIKD